MTNFEIRKRKEELDAELEQSIIDGINNFKLNEKTQFLMQQVTELQGQCTHQDDAGSTYNKNNICGICGHRITTGGTNGV